MEKNETEGGGETGEGIRIIHTDADKDFQRKIPLCDLSTQEEREESVVTAGLQTHAWTVLGQRHSSDSPDH